MIAQLQSLTDVIINNTDLYLSASLLQSQNMGQIVPKQAPGAESREQLNSRTVYVDQPVVGPNGKPIR